MKLQNNGAAVDVGRNNIFSKGEVREFDEADGAELLARYPSIEEVKAPKVVKKDSAIKRAFKKLTK